MYILYLYLYVYVYVCMYVCMYVCTVTRKSIGHIGFFKKIITSLVATNLKFELNIVDI